MSEQRPLVLVSNRGPVTFQEDGSVKRGTGGLVTALTGLASHRDAVWIASALTEGEVEKGREAGSDPFTVRPPAGGGVRRGRGPGAARSTVGSRAGGRSPVGSAASNPGPTTASTTSSRTRCS